MRVAVTFEQCWHPVPGGTARAAIEQTTAMLELGADDLELVGIAARHTAPPPAEWTPPAVRIYHAALPRAVLYRTWHAIGWPSVEQTAGPIDAVHATAMAVPPSRAPLVYTVHDLAFLDDPSVATRRGLAFFRRATELARERARIVLCSSKATMADCERAGFDPERLRLVPLGVRVLAVDDAMREAVRRRHHLDRPFVLFCGTVEPRKNLPRLVEAFRRVARDRDDVELVLVGPAGWLEDAGSLLAGLDGRARSIGFVPEPELRALYELADVVAYPSLREGFGLPVLEAMAQGAVVVTSSTTATAEVAGEAALTVDPLDVDAIAGGLRRALDDSGLRERLAAPARAQASRFTWRRTAELTLAAYRDAAG
jgi:glycosyltransferase involved in cell wall biosynthesis